MCSLIGETPTLGIFEMLGRIVVGKDGDQVHNKLILASMDSAIAREIESHNPVFGLNSHIYL